MAESAPASIGEADVSRKRMHNDAKGGSARERDPATLDYWTFVDHAVDRISEQFPGIAREPMLLLMTLRRATNLIFYDMHVKLNQGSALTSATALTLLLVLSACGPLEMRQLVRLSGQSRATVSALMTGLVAQGLVRRDTTADKRVIRLEMTARGGRLFDAAFSVFNRQEQFWAESLTREEQATLVSLLRKMVMARHDDERVGRRN
ncbi:MAG: MarR family transcriptional regulator [Ideonella sp.]|nr:MAG: MarR family transcriptional regulator [Burkholderiaceae bacterium]MBE7418050.1 MarR family transcriptional regulator [Ideonella sp.]